MDWRGYVRSHLPPLDVAAERESEIVEELSQHLADHWQELVDTGLPEEEATAIAVEIGLSLWRPAAAPFRWIWDHLPRWLEEAEGELQARARELLASLDVGRATLVHGDFHHQNILDAGGRHVAIDPQPFLGEPEFDVPSFLWNPLPCRLRLEHLESRLAAFAAAGLDEERMRIWTVIRGAYLQPHEAEALLALV